MLTICLIASAFLGGRSSCWRAWTTGTSVFPFRPRCRFPWLLSAASRACQPVYRSDSVPSQELPARFGYRTTCLYPAERRNCIVPNFLTILKDKSISWIASTYSSKRIRGPIGTSLIGRDSFYDFREGVQRRASFLFSIHHTCVPYYVPIILGLFSKLITIISLLISRWLFYVFSYMYVFCNHVLFYFETMNRFDLCTFMLILSPGVDGVILRLGLLFWSSIDRLSLLLSSFSWFGVTVTPIFTSAIRRLALSRNCCCLSSSFCV